MTFDWNVNLGHVLSAIVMLVAVGAYRQQFLDLRADVKEIKADLHAMIKDNTLLGNTVGVLQQRVMTCEQELSRARENIRRIANHMQGVVIRTKE